MNISKNKLNSKIILIFHSYPYACFIYVIRRKKKEKQIVNIQKLNLLLEWLDK